MDRLDTDAESEYLVPMTSYSIPAVTSPDYFDFAELVGAYVEDPRLLLILTNSVTDKVNEIVNREVDDALDSAGHPFQNIIREQEEELQSVYGQLNAQQDRRDDLHEVLVTVCLHSEVVGNHVRNGQKINAIKELRRLTNASLRASKEAVEDSRVWEPLAEWERELLHGPGNVGTEQPPGWTF